jgi:hypothetical protein
MGKTPSRYCSRLYTVTGEGTDLPGSGQTLVKTAGPTKGWKYSDQLGNYNLLKQDVTGAKPINSVRSSYRLSRIIRYLSLQKQNSLRRGMGGYHSGAAADLSLLGCDAVSWGEWFPTFRKIVGPSSSMVDLLVLLDTEDEKARRPFDRSEATHPTTRRHFPEDRSTHPPTTMTSSIKPH